MNINKIAFLFGVLILFISCKDEEFFTSEYGEILPSELIRVEYFDKSNCEKDHLNKSPDAIITDYSKIEELIKEINSSNHPTMAKGACWNEIHIVKNNNTVVLKNSGKLVSLNVYSGKFFQLKDTLLIERYFNQK